MVTTTSARPRAHSEETEEEQARMSFGEHLEELRKRIIRAALGSIVGVAVCVYYCKDIVLLVAQPYRWAMQSAGYPPIITMAKPTEVVMENLTLGVQAGLILSSPWIIYQIWAFVAAGLFQKERKVVYRYVSPSALLFLLGVAFFYFIVLPLTLRFFVTFSENTATGTVQPTVFEQWIMQREGPGIDLSKLPEGNDPDVLKVAPRIPVVKSDPPVPEAGPGLLVYNAAEGQVKLITKDRSLALMFTQSGSLYAAFPRLDDYLNFVMFTALIFGLAFELPMVIMILAQVDIVRTQTFRDIRKYAYFALVALSAVAAPSTDLMTMFCLFVPMIALYEIGIIAAAIVTRGRED